MTGDRIPVTVLTGFLGAGKTTLLNRLLRHPDMADTAVLINEFGEIGLDHLLVGRLDEDTVLLNAGCLCCTVRGDLMRALEDLAARDRPIRRVLVETTGLADPAPILQTLLGELPALRRFVLEGVVTVVDAVNGMATLDAQPEAVKQVAVADRLVLAKADLAPDHAALLDRLRALNPGAPVLAPGAGPEALLGAAGDGGYDPGRRIAEVSAWLAEEARPGDRAGHGHHHHRHDHDRNRHDARIHAFSVTFDEPLRWQGIAAFLEMLTATRGDSVLRVKGLLNLADDDRPVAIHGVQHVWHTPERLPAWPEGDDRRSRLVFILRDLDRATVETGLRAFAAAAG
ncbi:GTP-binding protein [Roseomonas sp. OT10]|uniref:CobW family GTP-binding protein n=1 Tax=Roseomonas cutis TaxID=2897332 RepID=UPI001E41019D|nr:GTP-binding protein [Roseomonas sp. OT10]UFN47495.1 GTP-binding protein [Roseomonas sp. OT10]